jgi:hypothetical protein
MAIDQLMLLFSNTSVVGDTNSDIIPLATTRQFGNGAQPLYIDMRVTVAFTDSGNNSTAVIQCQSSPYEAFNSSITNTTCATIATNAAVGDRLLFQIPPLAADKAFFRLSTVTAGGNFTTGSVTAWVTPNPEVWSAQPVGWTGPSLS